MRRIITTLILGLGVCLSLQAQHKASVYLTQQLNSSGHLKGAFVGVHVINASTGEVLVSHNGDKRFVTASTLKTLSTGAALLSLGPDYRFATTIAYDGEITPDGVLEGNIYIVGGADPSLGSKKKFACNLQETYRQWLSSIRAAGIRKVAGCVIGDDRFYSSPMEHPSWQWYDLGTYYGAGCSALTFHENKRDFNVSPGKAVGDPVNFNLVYPPLYGLDIDFQATTGEENSGNQLYLISTTLSPRAEFRGTYALGRWTKTEETANKFPAQTIAADFSQFLSNNGIQCIYPPRDVRNSFHEFEQPYGITPQDDLHKLTTTFSPTVKTLAMETLHASNNVFADNFLRYIGRVNACDDSYSASLKAEEQVFKDHLGIDFGANRIEDGSGLSRQDQVSPEFFCSYLAAMKNSPVYSDFLECLSAQGYGSLADMTYFNDTYTIYAKSGSMSGVRCYVGYIVPNSGDEDTLCFAVMVNSFSCPSSRIRTFIFNFLTSF